MNHYQYLFLLRLAEEATELATFLSLDSNRIMKVENSGSLAIGAIIPQLEVTFVMPSHCPGKESSGGDVESFVPDSSSIGDDVLMRGSTATVYQDSTFSLHKTSLDKPEKVEPAPITTTTVDSDLCFSMRSKVSNETATPLPTKKETSAITNIVPNNFNAGISSMKKGFSSLMTSIDSALKPSPEDMSDSLSVRSDGSSDSENYIFLTSPESKMIEQNVDAMFKVPEFHPESKAIIEVASEVIEEESTITTTSDHSLTSSCRRKDIVSVSTFKLTKVEFLQQSAGYSSSMKVQVGNIYNEDCTSIPWDEFQSKFSSRARAWADSANTTTNSKVKLRMDHDVKLPSSKSINEMDFTEKDALNKLFKDFIDVQVQDLNMDLAMSTITGLADLIEDEIIPIPIPLQITLNNVQLHMIEDRPPVNITSPGPIPLDLNVTHMFITREEDGVFNIIPNKPISHSESIVSTSEQEIILRQQNIQLKLDNDELRRRLAAFERVSEENRQLRRSKEETDILRSCLSSAQDDVSKLLDEKKRLLDDVKRLQDQLLSDRSRQWNSKR